MNKDLEVFENRSDDWLAKERKYEATVSAWDLDEGRKLRAEHEDNCEAREIKRSHEQRHQAYDNQFVNLNDLAKKRNETEVSKKTGLIILLLLTIVPLATIITVIIGIMSDGPAEVVLVMPIILLILIVNIYKMKRRKK